MFQNSRRNGQIITQEMIDKSRLIVNLKEPPKQPMDIIVALAGHPDHRQPTYYLRGKLQSRENTWRSVFDAALCFKRYFGTDYDTLIQGLEYLASVKYVFRNYCGNIRRDTINYAGSYYKFKSITEEDRQTFNNIILGKND